ncbi:protein-glucosylgalactosylhydroxylysine glucosidase-like [Toxorhynchites rutilus septentrionalis]|uniref:protein-glucosylgalactosylhydroxylysine glucosidase-like n=1 Tax=Toxorhynchites rutilus septentrionalis TaxID=329112 RepID=UPI002478DC23|nr:protein-glucosylgalactosylhydroxylysine glucosidase-like [Toxorhynchites rutilus septentrionalis]
MVVLLLVILILTGSYAKHSFKSTNHGTVATMVNGVISQETSSGPPTVDASDKMFGSPKVSDCPPSADERLLPTLANGHLGFTVFEDAIYMNGLYNGHRGLSHRAKIANVANLRLAVTDDGDAVGGNREWMDFEKGTFHVDYRAPNHSYRVVQLIYPHQFYNRAIVNQFTIERLASEDDIHIGIIQKNPSPGSEDILFSSTETFIADHDAERNINLSLSSSKIHRTQTVNIDEDEYSSAEAPSTFQVHQACGTTRELEDPEHPHQKRHVCVLWNHVPEELILKRFERTVSYKFIMTADESAGIAREELLDAISLDDEELLRNHSNIWHAFWSDFSIQTDGNRDLELVIQASIFYLISNFPLGALNRTRDSKAYRFGGLSPTGLGRGGGTNLNDYEGHSFWDSEIWMFPVINLIGNKFSEMMVDYRFRTRAAARNNAKSNGYRGIKYPWESASTGVEVIQPCCPRIAQFQHHVTADISFALRQYFSTTHDLDWLLERSLATEIAEFWASRLSFDPVTGLYDIKAVMGPDEDHENVTNNAYTNVVAAYALYFGDLTKCLKDDNRSPASGNWSALARRIKLLYDAENDYHPQFEDYHLGTVIKQADTVLLGYPLQYQEMTTQTRSNDLRFYENVTRRTGPAMTWAMHSINHLDLEEIEDAVEKFNRSYQCYVRGTFKVWYEVEAGSDGAINFITGAGGFLQAVIYGFGGVRLFLDRLEVRNTRLPPGSTMFRIKGLKYMGANMTLKATAERTTLAISQIMQDITIQIGDNPSQLVELNRIYDISKVSTVIRAAHNIYNNCPISEEILSNVNVVNKQQEDESLNQVFLWKHRSNGF